MEETTLNISHLWGGGHCLDRERREVDEWDWKRGEKVGLKIWNRDTTHYSRDKCALTLRNVCRRHVGRRLGSHFTFTCSIFLDFDPTYALSKPNLNFLKEFKGIS